MNSHLILLDKVDWSKVKWLPFALPKYDYARLGKEILVVLISLIAIRLLLAFFSSLIRLTHDLRAPQVVLEIRPPQVTTASAFSTTELFTLVAGVMQGRPWTDRLLLRDLSYSFEIVSTKEGGIRYLVRVPASAADILEKTLRAYQAGTVVWRTDDYAASVESGKVVSFGLARHFALPLQGHSNLSEHDPLAYLTASMAQLGSEELMALQIVLRPLRRRREVGHIKGLIRYDRFADWLPRTRKSQYYTELIGDIGVKVITTAISPLVFLTDTIAGLKPLPTPKKVAKALTPAEAELQEAVKGKLDQALFEVTVRTLVVASREQRVSRERGLRSSFAGFCHPSGQSLKPGPVLPLKLVRKFRRWQFRKRLQLRPSVLSASEVAALYHFPHVQASKTEDLLRVKSRELPAPLSLKNSPALDVVYGKNTYGNAMTLVGLTDEDRSRHVYLLGQTGSGKSTVIYHMAKDDIGKGRGIAVIDPHGDLAEDLLATVSVGRKDDLVYFNPYDIAYPIGINLLDLESGLTGDELELEKELVCESVISVFRRVFNKDENVDAHRIEYVLRNAIHTAFTVKDCTIFTVYDLLNDPEFRKKVIRKLRDPNLAKFWKNEFGKAGNYQVVKMVSGVTAKVGRFLFSPVAKRILEQPKSTVNFDDILDQKKILICNLAEGKIGEDTSQLLGTTIIAKVQQAAVRRARKELTSRTPFYLFVDEFQNFATSSFTKLLSGGRKFGLRVTIAEQSTAQQADRNVTNVILANAGTVICFRTASPVDEELMLSQFSPSVEKGDIGNLPRYCFYMRLSAVTPEAPFSGETLPMLAKKDGKKIHELVEASRKNYAAAYVQPDTARLDPSEPEPEPSAGSQEELFV